jgi:hypothetical protein
MRIAKSTVGAAGVAFAVAIAVATASAPAKAQSGGNDKVTAEALFEDARKLVADRRYAEACPKFADSQRLDPSAATLLNLASCWEKAGRTATAWATYKEAASAANAAGRKDYVTAAERHAEALAPTLSRLTVNVPTPIDGIQVKRDGINVERAEWGSALPVDPGAHTLEASAPGHKGWSTSVDVAPNTVQATATVPALEALPADATPVTPAVVPPPTTTAPPPETVTPPPVKSDGSAGSSQRVSALVVGGAGLAGVVVGAVLAVVAKNKYDTSLGNCLTSNHNSCSPAGLTERSDARTAGDIATVAFIAGGAAVAGGLVLWITAPNGTKAKDSAATPALVLAPTLGGAMLRGTF